MYARSTTFDRANAFLTETVLITLFVTLTALGAQFAIRLPFSPVPVTLQVLVVIVSGLVLGARRGFSSQLGYLAAGAMGLPVFAGGAGGLGVLLGPTGGYLLAFPLAASAAGLVRERLDGPRLPLSLLGSFLAIALIYAGGSVWLAAWLQVTASQSLGGALVEAWNLGVKPFLLFDLVKVGLAAVGIAGGRLALLHWFGVES
jgi:biotin transport system substrate-specific component